MITERERAKGYDAESGQTINRDPMTIRYSGQVPVDCYRCFTPALLSLLCQYRLSLFNTEYCSPGRGNMASWPTSPVDSRLCVYSKEAVDLTLLITVDVPRPTKTREPG